MWFLGHLAISLPVALGLARLMRREVGANELFLLMFFANLPDFFHVSLARDLTSHNVIGGAIIFAFAFYAFRDDASFLAAVAFASHYAGDLLFSSLRPLYPIFSDNVALYPWNTPEDVLFEAVLGVFFAVLLYQRVMGAGRMSGVRVKLASLATLALMAAQTGLFVALNLDVMGTSPFYLLWLGAALAVCGVYWWGMTGKRR